MASESQQDGKQKVMEQIAGQKEATKADTNVQIDEAGKAQPKADYDPAKPKPVKTLDPDADAEGDSLATKMAKAKKRKAKAAGQADALK